MLDREPPTHPQAMAAFALHVPTMLAMLIVCSLMMAIAMAVVGWGRRRDGLEHWAASLLVNVIGHTLRLLRGHVPDLLSIVLGNTLLSGAFVGLIAAIYQFQGRPVRGTWLFAPTALVAGASLLWLDELPLRFGAVAIIIGLQAGWALAAALGGYHATAGRGWWLLVAGLGLEALALAGRAALAFGSGEGEVLHSPAVLASAFLSTFSVVLLSSMGFVFMLRDRADENNRTMAALDPLTGVANRRSLIASLTREVAHAVRARENIALMMVDIDYFKDVNDQYGHPVGDQVLCNVVNVLRQRVRAQDLVGRYGGEEFMVLLPDTGLAGAERLARELCQAVEDSCCRIGGENAPGARIATTVSIGVFGGPLEAGDSWDMLVAAADRALYQAKENGRNRVAVSTSLRRPCALGAAQTPAGTLPI